MLITHALVATLGDEPRLIEDGALRIEGAKITAVGNSIDLISAYPHEQTLDAHGQLALPAALCGHTHFYGAFARGWAFPGPAPTRFGEILDRLWWKLDKLLTPEDVQLSAQVCLVDAIKHGTTTLVDHHASPFAVEGSLDIIAKAVMEAGVRASLCYEVSDRDGPDIAKAGIEENVRFLQSLQTQPYPQLAASFGLHASLTLSNETLENAVNAAQGMNTGFHIHAAEGIEDLQDSLQRSGKRVIHRLNDHGILGPQSIVAHAVHVDSSEMDVLAGTGTWVTHQPRSNMNNAVGFAQVEAMLDHGVKIALGNDGFSNNMFAEMKTAYLGHKLVQGDPRAMPGNLIFDLAWPSNASLAKIFWPESRLGVLEAGAEADVILLDYHPTTPMGAGNLPWHMLFGYEASAITTTISAGKVLMQNRQLTTMDEATITAKSRELAQKLWDRV